MLHTALRIAFALFLAWLGLDVLLLIALGAVALFRRITDAMEARERSWIDEF